MVTGGMSFQALMTRSFTEQSIGTAGLGKITITRLAEHNPSQIFFSGRDTKKASQVVNSIKAAVPGVRVDFIRCDLASHASIDAACKQLIASTQRLDILIWQVSL